MDNRKNMLRKVTIIVFGINCYKMRQIIWSQAIKCYIYVCIRTLKLTRNLTESQCCRDLKFRFIKAAVFTCMGVDAERSSIVSVDNGVCNLGTCVCVSAGCMHPQHLGAHRNVFCDGGSVLTPLKHWRVVVDVQDGNTNSGEGGETARAPTVGDASAEGVERLKLTVQRTIQMDDARLLIDGEHTISRVQQ